MKYARFFFLSLVFLMLAGCIQSTSQAPVTAQPPVVAHPPAAAQQNTWPALEVVEAYPNLSFTQPLAYLPAADGSNRVFVVEKSGRIITFENNPQATETTVFLDLSSRVNSRASEKGLLGMAFHPQYTQNGFFYVNYTTDTDTVIARYQVNPANPKQGLLDSEQILLTIPQPYDNHNGGHLVFGPDGFLYIGTGDGGSAGDPQGNAQNLTSLLGKMLRISVDQTQGDKRYNIPADNPFVGNQKGYREEIFAYGLRNPWKYSFDTATGRLWTADVGQGAVEEIDFVEKGMNYGWNIMEGSLCYPESANCSQEGLKLPVWEYRHPLGESITGGYVYHGTQIPNLTGAYIYGDFVTGLIWGLRLDSAQVPQNQLLVESKLHISSFGIDQDSELYIIDFGGKIYKFKPTAQ